MAIRYILCNPAITAPIPGLINAQQVDNVAVAVKERRSLDLAREHGLRSIAFPAISTGVYRFPIERATRIAVQTVRRFIHQYKAGRPAADGLESPGLGRGVETSHVSQLSGYQTLDRQELGGFA